MKNYLHLYLLAFVMLVANCINAQTTVINTSFESGDYSIGSLSGQNNWALGGGTAEVVTAANYIKEGTQGVKVSGNFELDHVAYEENATGLSNVIYMDCWLKVNTAPVEEVFQLTARDFTPDGSDKRNVMIEIRPSGVIRAYNGGSKVEFSNYTFGEWVRISFFADYSAEKYRVAVNGVVDDNEFDFRETYDATEKGRSSNIKEYHALRFMFEESFADVAIGSVYVGEDAISDIDFPKASTERTITLEQPENATIVLNPLNTDFVYEVGTQVSATVVDVADHYLFNGWTGALSGTKNPIGFTVETNMSIGADVIIDENDPPAEYTIALTQSTGGTISVVAASDDAEEQFSGLTCYEGTEVTFSAEPEIGYEFTSWTGIEGTTNKEKVTVSSDLDVSAVFTKGTYSNRLVNVSTTSELEDALDEMQPGDSIVLADGTYNGAGAGLTRLGGNATNPVWVTAANVGGAKIIGDGYFSLTNCSYITFKGIDFSAEVYTLFKLTDCNNIRITQNTFKNSGNGGSKLILIGGAWDATSCASHHNRIDHNLFDTKTDGGAWLVIDGSHGGTPQVSQYDRIDHNHFRFNGPRATNEKETIRIGMSDLSLSSAFCTVENNYFEECDGDPEIISVKSCDNYIRNNTFVKCLGTVSLRHGNRTEVSGNFFLGQGKTAEFTNDDNETSTIGCGGVRVYGKDHKIFNNYFEGLTGSKWDAACTLTCGDKTNVGVTNSSDLTAHYLIENLEFTHNTLVNCESDIEIGYRSDWGKAPINVTIANNIIIQDSNKIVQVITAGKESGVSFANNIFYTTGTATIGDMTLSDAEAKNVDPGLERTNCRAKGEECDAMVPVSIYKLTSTSSSEVIDPSVTAISYVTSDCEGQLSVNARDLGADEFNSTSAITNGVLTPAYVGPDAIDFVESGNFTQYQITLRQTTGGTVSVNPASGPYYEGSTVIFTAVADSNYTFASWTGISGTTTEESVVITSDLTVSATFNTVASAIDLEEEKGIQVMPNPFNGNTQFVTNGSAKVSVYNIQGKLVDTFTMVGSYNWTAASAGIYIGIIESGNQISKVKLIAK